MVTYDSGYRFTIISTMGGRKRVQPFRFRNYETAVEFANDAKRIHGLKTAPLIIMV